MKLLLCLLGLLCATTILAQEGVTAETVLADRNLWPREVTVNTPHEVVIVVNGKASGSMQAEAGRTYPVKSISASGVQIDAMGQPMTFAIEDTDLLARASVIDERLKAIASAAPPAAAPTPTPQAVQTPTPPQQVNSFAKGLSGLVALDGRKLKSFDAKSLETKKYLAVYFSASWCGPCRRFTPELVSWYKKKKSSLDKFDVIFVSSDKTEEDMLGYMVEDKMAWPAVQFDQKRNSPLRSFSGRGIPCLVILDENGKVLSHSYENGEYVGPTKVLKDLDKLLKES